MAKDKRKLIWQLLLVLYGGIMLWLLFGRTNRWVDGISYREQLQQNANLVPFYTIGNYIKALQNPYFRPMRTECIINLGGNILLFIPAGLLFPRVWHFLRKFFVFLAFCAGVMLLVETAQLFTFLGCFDVDDLILNLVGMCIGFGLYKISAKG